MEQHFSGNVALKAILAREDGRVLLTRDERDGGLWEIPGGRMNVGERPEAALMREMREEVGVEVFVTSIIYADTIFHVSECETMMLVVYEVALSSPISSLTCDVREVAEIAWVNETEYQRYTLFEPLKKALDIYFEKRR